MNVYELVSEALTYVTVLRRCVWQESSYIDQTSHKATNSPAGGDVSGFHRSSFQ